MIIILIILDEEMKKEKKIFEMISRSLLLNIKGRGGGDGKTRNINSSPINQ